MLVLGSVELGSVELGSVELALFAVATIFPGRMPGFRVVEARELPALRRLFDAELGWHPHWAGARPVNKAYGNPALAAFGDSFTAGAEVARNETWESFLAGELGRDVPNFGVNGYGPDQALLRFRATATDAPVVALGFITENIGRVVNVYRRFYEPRSPLAFTKPRFVWDRGALALRPNPVTDVARLTDPDFVAGLGKDDRWYRPENGGPPRFPYSRILLRSWRVTDVETLWEEPDTVALFFAIFDAFAAEAQRRGARPLFILFPMLGQHGTGGAAFATWCGRTGHACCDTTGALSAEGSFRRVHPSPAGNRAIARAVRACYSRP